MKIKYKKEGNFEKEFNEYFKSVDELTYFISENNKFINVINLTSKINDIYNKLSNLDLIVKSSLLPDIILKHFNFKVKRPNNIQFWIERGYGIDEFNKYNSKGNVIKPLCLNNKNIFKYNKFKFELYGEPKCNLCQSSLVVKPSIDRYEIIKCANECCSSQKNLDITTIRQLAFLPLELFKVKNKRININYKNTKEYWLLHGYTYDEAKNNVNKIKKELKNHVINTFEYFKILTDLSDFEINEFINSMSMFKDNYWVKKGLEPSQIKEKISQIQKSNSNKLKISKLESPHLYKGITETQLEYWLKIGYNEEEAKLKRKDRQRTFSKEICIQKHGKDEGLKKFTSRQEKWNKSLSSGGKLKIGYSKISQDLFYKLLNQYDIIDRNNIKFATHNGELKLNRKNGGIWLYDFTDLKNKKIIEYHGDDFHGNPKKYNSDDTPNPFRKDITAKQIWEKDDLKIQVANENDYEVLIIWDSEYRWGNKEKIINKCLEFLKK